MLGLSATPNRKDGLRRVFEWSIGPMVYSTKEKNKDYIETRMYEYTNDNPIYSKEEFMYGGKLCLPRMINNLCGCSERNKFIENLVLQEYKLGRKILILSDRRGYLEDTKKNLNQILNKDIAGLYIGGMKPHELRTSQEKDIILGTYSMASEGMDIPKLNTIFLASPKSDVVQSVGRILREKADVRKFHPLIIDFKDIHPNLVMFSKQCDKRLVYYKRNNHEIHLYAMDGSKEKIEKRKKRSKKMNEKVLNDFLSID
jgi:superfamily II DNA or RNA helicase